MKNPKELIVKFTKTGNGLLIMLVYESIDLKYNQQKKRVKRNRKKYKLHIRTLFRIIDPPLDIIRDLQEVKENRQMILLIMNKGCYNGKRFDGHWSNNDWDIKQYKSLFKKIIDGYSIVKINDIRMKRG